MQQVLTLCAAPGALAADTLATAARLLAEAGARVGDPTWLAPGEAADIPFDSERPVECLARVRVELKDAPVDVNGGPAAGRRKRLLIADMDSTIIVGESLDELAEYAGIRDQIAAITARAMRGELDFEGALRERVGMLKGLPATTIDTVVDGLQLTPGADVLVATMKAAGAYCALVSGGFKPMTGAIRQRIGFDEDRSNILHVADGVLAGTVGEPILGRDAKLATLKELCAAHGLALDAALAVGDGANDLAMLGAAGMGVAFQAKPAVRDAAGFRIEHADLRGLLYLQGYKVSDFATGSVAG
ncbi:phosphoserine phosphatase SerB [Thalassobaculum salexigens]|uniref:phosphoserine phosphatase SerB n=1 Tax=Thalassobaculum salexigens TaxID=455360 RepID=UPI0003F5F9A8|nr:phosphoserine phosphatase SerB [Thalassobaculum salexigens]